MGAFTPASLQMAGPTVNIIPYTVSPNGRAWRKQPAPSSAGTVSICPDPSPERWTVAFCVSDGALKALIRSDAVPQVCVQ